MRALLTAAILLVLGMVGIVVVHERGKDRPAPGLAADTVGVVATISRGERVDIQAHVARQGLTIVEFTAEF